MKLILLLLPVRFPIEIDKNTLLISTLVIRPFLLNKKWDFKWVFKSRICRKLWPKMSKMGKSTQK